MSIFTKSLNRTERKLLNTILDIEHDWFSFSAKTLSYKYNECLQKKHYIRSSTISYIRKLVNARNLTLTDFFNATGVHPSTFDLGGRKPIDIEVDARSIFQWMLVNTRAILDSENKPSSKVVAKSPSVPRPSLTTLRKKSDVIPKPNEATSELMQLSLERNGVSVTVDVHPDTYRKLAEFIHVSAEKGNIVVK